VERETDLNRFAESLPFKSHQGPFYWRERFEFDIINTIISHVYWIAGFSVIDNQDNGSVV